MGLFVFTDVLDSLGPKYACLPVAFAGEIYGAAVNGANTVWALFPYLGGTSRQHKRRTVAVSRANKSKLMKPIEHGDVVDFLPLRIHARRCCCS